MRLLSVIAIAILMLGPVLVRAQDTPAEPETAQPSAPAPKTKPPAPPKKVSPPPQAVAQPPQARATAPGPAVQSLENGQWVQTTGAPVAVAPPRAGGQWVFTDQYGWVWIPYGSQYTYAPTLPGASPYQYVYYPRVGWSWLLAPWVFGWGVGPYFGVYGTSHFPWYGQRHYGNYGYYGGYGGYGYYGRGYGHYGGYPSHGYYPGRAYGGYVHGPGYGGVQTWRGPGVPAYGGGVQTWRGSAVPAYGGGAGTWRGTPPATMQGRSGGFHGGGFQGSAPRGGGGYGAWHGAAGGRR